MQIKSEIKIALTTSDKIMEILGWTIVAFSFVFTVWSYLKLPDTIAIHFDGAGKPDGFGSKGNIVLLPCISTSVFILLTVLNKFPQVFNFPTEITADNALQQYTLATRFIRVLKTVIAGIFAALLVATYTSAMDNNTGLGNWFLPLYVAAIFIPIIFYSIKSLRAK